MQFAQRLDAIETSAIRELFKLLGKPGIISFAGGFRQLLAEGRGAGLRSAVSAVRARAGRRAAPTGNLYVYLRSLMRAGRRRGGARADHHTDSAIDPAPRVPSSTRRWWCAPWLA